MLFKLTVLWRGTKLLKLEYSILEELHEKKLL